jgi:hypothetical protein
MKLDKITKGVISFFCKKNIAKVQGLSVGSLQMLRPRRRGVASKIRNPKSGGIKSNQLYKVLHMGVNNMSSNNPPKQSREGYWRL